MTVQRQSLRAALIGSWTLVDYVEETHDGAAENRPAGKNPSGAIIYSADGYMSAQMAVAPGDPIDPTQPHGYRLAYAGPFTVDEGAGLVIHNLELSVIPAMVGQRQVRAVTFPDAHRLMLRATEPLELDGERVIPKITWQRIDRGDA